MPEPLIVETVRNADRWKWRILIGIPSLGQVRIEWALAMMSTVLPMNFSTSSVLVPVGFVNPLRFHVAEAQNIIVGHALNGAVGWEWLLFIEDDVVPPPSVYTRMRSWVECGKYPVVSGLYNLKTHPQEPMVFRGRGNGSYKEWKNGPGDVEKNASLPEGITPEEVVFCDGVPTGCLMISTKLLKVAWEASPQLLLRRKMADGTTQQIITREVFKTVREAGIDPETATFVRKMSTSDLDFCDKVMDNGWMKEAGFDEAAEMEYPFVVDTAIACGHVDLSTGRAY